jgi:hypothetical protein
MGTPRLDARKMSESNLADSSTPFDVAPSSARAKLNKYIVADGGAGTG